MTNDELNERKYELETKRFEFEKERALRERSFLTRNAATLITGSISLATIFVSCAVAYNAYRQTEQTRIIEDSKLQQTRIESERKWRNDALVYTTAQYDAIYSGATEKQKRILSLIKMVFPKDIYELTLAHLKIAAPTKDGPNVWAQAEQESDKQDLASDIPVPTITLPEDLSTVDTLRGQLYSPERRSVSNALVEQYKSGNKSIISLLVGALLPQDDNRSYRTNLYVAYTLARIPGKWEGTSAEIAKIDSLKATTNYKDPTFAQWVDKAVTNAEAAPNK